MSGLQRLAMSRGSREVRLATGVHCSPEDQEVQGVGRGEDDRAVEFHLTSRDLDTLVRMGVNAICDLGNGRGVRVISALTMSVDAKQRSIGARRFLSFVEESIRLGTAWARFEANDERLWTRIADNVGTFLKSLWETGAL